jgi:hypothetical protein
MASYVTREDVKKAVKFDADELQMDPLLDQLVVDVTSHIDRLLGDRAPLLLALYQEDYNGSQNIYLRHRPVTSVVDVRSDTSYAFGTDTIIDSALHVVDTRLGAVRFIYYTPPTFPLCIRVNYNGGYAAGAVPPLVRRLAVEMVTAHLKQRDNPTVVAKGNRDGNLTKTDPLMWDDIISRRLAPLMGTPFGN